MNFNLSGHIIQIEKEIKAHSKCIIKDSLSSVMILVPISLLKDVSLNDEVEIWGQLKGYDYNGKIYNNLFAKGIITSSRKFILAKKENTQNENEFQFKILQRSPNPFNNAQLEELTKELAGIPEINTSEKNSPVKSLLNRARELGSYYNIYSSHLQKALEKEYVKLDGEIILLNENAHFFSKNIEGLKFAYFNTRQFIDLTIIPISFFDTPSE